MNKQYDEIFKKQCVELVIKEGRTIYSIQREFNLFWYKGFNEFPERILLPQVCEEHGPTVDER
ncbi:hypothetical protein ACLNAL_29495 [Bacillus sp. AF62]|uniref:hypothetical protein n=1 Tax=Bacillus sp. AF62 TaxID=3158960 RepID=UPI00398F797C